MATWEICADELTLNETLYCDGFHISYFQYTEAKIPIVETALVDYCGEKKFYILKGDWRKQFEEVVEQGFAACYKIFQDNLDKQAHASDDPKETVEHSVIEKIVGV